MDPLYLREPLHQIEGLFCFLCIYEIYNQWSESSRDLTTTTARPYYGDGRQNLQCLLQTAQTRESPPLMLRQQTPLSNL